MIHAKASKKFIQRASATLGVAALLFSAGAVTADKELLDILLKNGAIDRKQYDSLMKKDELHAKDAGAIGNVSTTLNGNGLRFETADKNFSFRMNGRLHADGVYQGDNGLTTAAGRVDETGTHTGTANDANDGVGIRRARIEFAGTFYKDWNWRMQYEFANNTKTLFKDMWIQYAGWDFASITVGEQKRPFSLQEMMSSNDMVFTERSYDYAFAAPWERAIGLRFDKHGKDWTAAWGVFGDSVNGNANGGGTDVTKDDQGWSTAGRVTWAAIAEHDKAIHLGLSGAYTKPEDSVDDTHSRTSFAVKPAGIVTDMTLLQASLNNVRSYTNVGAEAAAVYGAFSLEGEYVRSFIDRENMKDGTQLTDLTFDGWHMDATYSLTGESRRYDGSTGQFGRLKPNRNFDLAGGLGALELAGRIMQIDMNDQAYKAGRATASSFGVNWYVNNNVRLMADYTHVWDIDNKGHGAVAGTASNSGDPSDFDYAQMRASLAF